MEAVFPRQAASVTTTPRPNTTVIPIIATPSTTEQSDILLRFDPEYFITVPGILKIFQISLSILGFICIQVSFDRSSALGKYQSWVSMIAILFSGSLLGMYVFHVVEKYQHRIPWLKIELGFCSLWTLLSLVAACLLVTQWENSPFIAAGSFGLRTTVAYGIDVYLKWGGVMRGHLAQAPRVECQCLVTTAANSNTPVISIVGSSTI